MAARPVWRKAASRQPPDQPSISAPRAMRGRVRHRTTRRQDRRRSGRHKGKNHVHERMQKPCNMPHRSLNRDRRARKGGVHNQCRCGREFRWGDDGSRRSVQSRLSLQGLQCHLHSRQFGNLAYPDPEQDCGLRPFPVGRCDATQHPDHSELQHVSGGARQVHDGLRDGGAIPLRRRRPWNYGRRRRV